jgi:beta-glucosidase
MNPFIFGEYPDIMKKNVASRLPFFTSRESNLVKGSIDFLGINFYYAYYVKNNAKSLQEKNRDYTADMAVELKRMIISMSFTVLHDQFYIEFKQVAYT